MIYITGDTHGDIDFEKLELYFKKKKVCRKDYLIILGDAGIVWDKSSLKRMILNYESLGLTVFYIDGNHENFDMLNKFPIIEKNNALVHQISKYIFHVLRGEILIIKKLKFLCIGGAESMDKMWRQEGISWWRNESITSEDVEIALLNAKKYNYTVDYVLTHAAPSKIHTQQLGFEISDSVIKLNKIEKYVKYNNWYFGHYHIDEKFDNNYRCFYYDILEI